MRLSVLALVGGLAVAVLAGGRLSDMPAERVRGVPLSVGAAVLYWAPSVLEVPSSAALLLVLCAYAALLAFTVVNLRLRGMAVVGVGLGLNALVILANGGMPVDPASVVAAGVARSDELAGIELGPARQWQEPDDRLAALGDVVPVRVLHEVVSFGDLVLAAGLANVGLRLLHPMAARRPSRPFRRRGGRRWSRLGLPAGPWAAAK
jgi:hypothetical protein